MDQIDVGDITADEVLLRAKYLITAGCTCGHTTQVIPLHDPKCGYRITNELCNLVVKYRKEAEKYKPFFDELTEALIVDCIFQNEHETNARKAVHDLCHWEQTVALDPKVSKEAQDLVTAGFKKAVNICAELITAADKMRSAPFHHDCLPFPGNCDACSAEVDYDAARKKLGKIEG